MPDQILTESALLAEGREQRARFEADPSREATNRYMAYAARVHPVLLGQLEAARARIAGLEAAIDRVRQAHEPIDAMNYGHRRPQLAQVCFGCGTDAGNWQMYPCPTIRALEVQP